MVDTCTSLTCVVQYVLLFENPMQDKGVKKEMNKKNVV